MSKLFIREYRNQLERVIKFGGSSTELAIRQPLVNLINAYAEPRNLMLIAELTTDSQTQNTKIRPDGTLKNLMRLDCGYLESKDSKDDLEKEIEAKMRKGYPLTNTIFEDSRVAVLFQNNERVLTVDMRDDDELDKLLTMFVTLELPYVREFNKALEQFKTDIPKILNTFRELIATQHASNARFHDKFNTFWESCKSSINEGISKEDINEMIIQHLLTSDLFARVFDDPYFHRENNIAQEIEQVIGAFMNRETRMRYLKDIEYYYLALQDGAKHIYDHHDKQEFLKTVYENFYKVYNPKAADKLGVVYTPNEIVRFMLESTDYLLEKHFGRTLASKNVEILDPATGTGTFIADLIDYLPLGNLPHKFKHEIHANEIAILPYYIANLNIEYTYKQRTGEYAAFENICLVDTLDNVGALAYDSKQHSMFSLSSENTERIRRQNERKISVIIGNPPYNANQQNENDNNKNRIYKEIDERIKNTFIKYSTAQKTKVYDMYARFYRWAMDRIDKNGVIAFITNRSFIDSRTFDGFRKCIEQDFDYCYIVDTQSDVRANPKISGTGHNVFGIQTGVAIMFLIRKQEKEKSVCQIHYFSLRDEQPRQDKLTWFAATKFKNVVFEQITPDEKHNWINLTDNNWDSLMPVCDKTHKNTIFKFYSLGVSTNRDEWVYDFDKNNLKNKINYFINTYNDLLATNDLSWNTSIKWSRDLKKKFEQKKKLLFDPELVKKANYRPFTVQYWYGEKILNDILTQNHYQLFGRDLQQNQKIIAISGNGASKNFQALAFDTLFGLDTLEKTNCLPLHTYDAHGNQVENITDWALEQFRAKYGASCSKLDIFHYIYAVLHHPTYRQTYEQNLKRDFPRVPLYDDLAQWAAWGKALLDLHIKYETAEPYALQRVDVLPKPKKKKDESLFAETTVEPLFETPRPTVAPKTKLRADKELGEIQLDEQTKLTGVPPQAWAYKLGNRSALEWILDQYKESTPSDPTIREQFNTYRFADYKDHVIDLLCRVCTVSVQTMDIISQMPS